MKRTNFVLGICCLLFLGGVAKADRQLSRSEILQIFDQLTKRPMKTWISSGTIEASHEQHGTAKTTNEAEINDQITQAVRDYLNNPRKRELTEELQKMRLDAIPFNVRYKLSNQHAMNSTVVVKFDGNRFSWDITVKSRTDSVRPPASLAGNFMTEQFNLSWNARRTFTWDGKKYTIYSRSGNYALVDAAGTFPHAVNGPLTAGVVPWGYGRYTSSSLTAASSSAIEKNVNGQTQIHLTVNYSDGVEMLFVLDPQKDYALISHLKEGLETTVSVEYGNYQMVSGRWVPRAITVEKYDGSSNKLLGYHVWNFTSISGSTPSFESFDPAYEPDTLIEHYSNVTDVPSIYRTSQVIDTELLLNERLMFAASEGAQAQNCATAAMKYVTSRLGKDVTDRQLAQLVDGTNNGTSLYEMKNFALRMGFHCRAVRTDIATLKNLSGCQAILHIPSKDHFVAIGDIDNQYVWSIDLANSKFCYRSDINFFDMDWTGGVALLISNGPITGAALSDISDAELRTINGRSGYTCTSLLQQSDVTYCTVLGGECWGNYVYYPERHGCESAPSGMCMDDDFLMSAESACSPDIYYPSDCEYGEWTFYYMRACS